MTACPHTPSYPDPLHVPSMEECKSHCSIVEDDEKVAKQRALTGADGLTTQIDAAYWKNLDDTQRAAVIAHERGHPQIGMAVNCEGCADKMGGYFMRAWGFSPDVVRSAYVSLKVGRKAGQGHIADNAASGAKAAERAMAGRGLLGLSSTTLAQKRTAAQLALKTPTIANQVKPPTSTPLAPAAANAVDPGGPRTAPSTAPDKPSDTTAALNPSGTATAPNGAAPNTVATGTTNTDPVASSFAGDAVAAVLGEDARPHTGKVLIAAGVAATIALILVVVVRRATAST